MKINIYIILLFSDIMCGLPKDKPLNIVKEKFANVDSNIARETDDMLSKQVCYPINILEYGQYCGVTNIEKLDSSLYLSPNAKGAKIFGPSDIPVRDFSPFCYAYQNPYSEFTNIVCYQGEDNYSDKFVLKLDQNLSFDCDLISVLHSSKIEFETEKKKLPLDKSRYEVGDTIRGYLMYQGRIKGYEHTMWKYLFHFRCVVGTSNNPRDYISTFQRCTGLITERSFGTEKNIIIPYQKQIK